MKPSKKIILPAELPEEVWAKVVSGYQKRFGLVPFWIQKDGTNPQYAKSHIANLPILVKARIHALEESIRWGETHTEFLLPNVIFWVVPVEHKNRVIGGIVGGEVAVDDDPFSKIEAVNHLAANKCPRDAAICYVNQLPVWEEQTETRKAGEYLFQLFYQHSAWETNFLFHNHIKQVQQRQIAQEIHVQKKGLHSAASIDEERQLLSMIKAGDLRSARKTLNRTLGIMFNETANLPLLRAKSIEMMGYLVRAAVEDNPAMGGMIEKNHQWMMRIIEGGDFEDIAQALLDALEDFMRSTAIQGHSKPGESLLKVLSWLNEHYHEPVSLAQAAKVVQLSPYRLAHILKKSTGKTLLEHLHSLRIQEAQRLLEHSQLSCAEIAYEVGYNDQSYFIKQFRKLMGVTPSRYRRH